MMTAIVIRVATTFLWGLVATLLLTTIMLGSQGLGLSRLSLPYLFGTIFTDRLRPAYLLGYILYALGGWAFAFLYAAIFISLGLQTWWLGALFGLLHGAFLLVTLFHVPYIHPHMASEHDPPRSSPVLEPPGFLGLHYGRQTPVIALIGHVVYGAALGASPTFF